MPAQRSAAKPLVIVESPAKARTIARFLGRDFVIEASVGHVRDLPANAAEIPPALKKEKWARLGIDVENEFQPLYVVPKDKRDHIRRLKQLVRDASVVYLATDEDREGESISWHLVDELKPKVEVKRLVFHEITEHAIRVALENPRSIDEDLVEAQETRRLVDRLYGYSVSPLLWKKVRPKLSAGRVQSVAVRLVVEREKERIRFVPADYQSLLGRFRTAQGEALEAVLARLDGKRIAVGKDFDPDTGRLKTDAASEVVHLDETRAKELAARLSGREGTVESVEKKPYTERPQPPFTTSTLQQEAGKKLGFTAKRTMRAAQRLYENGHITYMRTDSTTLSDEALRAARKWIGKEYGAEHLPDAPRAWATKVKNAQEAHEAIRPAGEEFVSPNRLNGDMGDDERRLYELIWKRTIACQMKDAQLERTTVTLAIDDARFTASGRVVRYPGFRLAWSELPEDHGSRGEDDADERDRILPAVREGEQVETKEIEPRGHTTKPPARLTEASLVKELEARGIGRPSTYASIIDTILQREYCFKRGAALVPTFTAFAVVDLLDRYLHWLVDYAFTARMENDLDEISNGRMDGTAYLKSFFLGNGRPGLRDQLEDVDGKIDPREVCTLDLFDLGEFEGGKIEVRVGRYGPFLATNGVSASLPDEFAPDELTRDFAVEILRKAAEGPKALGADPETGLPVYVKVGRFGPYFQLGDPDSLGGEKPKMASLLRGMEPETVSLDDALQVLSLPRKLGELTLPESEPGAGETHVVEAHNGRFGPYLKCGKATRSIPPDEDLLTIGLDKARELFAQPKQRGRGVRAQAKVLKELGEHPDTKAPIRILDGRYGAYVTDGDVNATIPKDESESSLSLARAIELIDKKRAAGGGKKKRGAKKKTAKKTAARKAPARKSGKKKAAKKKS